MVIGSYQSVRNEIDAEAAERYGIEVARRISGGGAMFMERGNCITYSLVVPDSLVEGLSFEQSYAFLDDWVLGALREVGIAARYVPLNDIASDKGKIGGAAQKRFGNHTVLHHATMAYDIDADKMMQVLADRPREALRQGHQEREQAGRPDALADRSASRRDHRRHARPLPPALRHSRIRLHRRRTGAGSRTRRAEVPDAGVDLPGAVSRLAGRVNSAR